MFSRKAMLGYDIIPSNKFKLGLTVMLSGKVTLSRRVRLSAPYSASALSLRDFGGLWRLPTTLAQIRYDIMLRE